MTLVIFINLKKNERLTICVLSRKRDRKNLFFTLGETMCEFDALVSNHDDNMSWHKRIGHISEVFSKFE